MRPACVALAACMCLVGVAERTFALPFPIPTAGSVAVIAPDSVLQLPATRRLPQYLQRRANVRGGGVVRNSRPTGSGQSSGGDHSAGQGAAQAHSSGAHTVDTASSKRKQPPTGAAAHSAPHSPSSSGETLFERLVRQAHEEEQARKKAKAQTDGSGISSLSTSTDEHSHHTGSGAYGQTTAHQQASAGTSRGAGGESRSPSALISASVYVPPDLKGNQRGAYVKNVLAARRKAQERAGRPGIDKSAEYAKIAAKQYPPDMTAQGRQNVRAAAMRRVARGQPAFPDSYKPRRRKDRKDQESANPATAEELEKIKPGLNGLQRGAAITNLRKAARRKAAHGISR